MLLALLLAQSLIEPDGPIYSDPSRMNSYAFFEFAPTSGAGMGAPCACTAVTGARGEAMTLTRGSSAYCTKEGLATTGLTTTSMVYCGSNLPRAEYDSNGVLGTLTEESRTNSALRSEELDNAAWSSTTTAGPLTVTANYATSPANTATAERLEISACSVADTQSIRLQTTALAASATHSIYARGTSGTASFSLCAFAGVGGTCTVCSVVAGSWSRCSVSLATASAQSIVLGCNNNPAYAGASNTGAADIVVWGAQVEAGTFATSYIPTTSAAVTRSVDLVVEFLTVTTTSLASAGSAAISVTPLAAANINGALVYMGGNGRPIYAPSAASVRMFDGTNDLALAPGFVAGTTKRYWSSWAGSSQTITNVTDVTQATGSFDGAMQTATLNVGSNFGSGPGNWIVSRVCLDPNPLRCR